MIDAIYMVGEVLGNLIKGLVKYEGCQFILFDKQPLFFGFDCLNGKSTPEGQ